MYNPLDPSEVRSADDVLSHALATANGTLVVSQRYLAAAHAEVEGYVKQVAQLQELIISLEAALKARLES